MDMISVTIHINAKTICGNVAIIYVVAVTMHGNPCIQ